MYLILLVADEEVARSLKRELTEKLESGQASLDMEFFTSAAEALVRHNAELARRNLYRENCQLAAAALEPVSAEHHSAYPGAYRTMIVCNDEGILTAAWRELTHHSSYETLYHVLRQKALHHPKVDWESLKFVVDHFASPQEALEHAKKTPLGIWSRPITPWSRWMASFFSKNCKKSSPMLPTSC